MKQGFEINTIRGTINIIQWCIKGGRRQYVVNEARRCEIWHKRHEKSVGKLHGMFWRIEIGRKGKVMVIYVWRGLARKRRAVLCLEGHASGIYITHITTKGEPKLLSFESLF